MAKKFGIYSPVLGTNQNVPSLLLNKAATPETENILFYRQRIMKLPLRTADFMDSSSVQQITPDGCEVMAIANMFDGAGSESVLVFTKRNVYKWSGTGYTTLWTYGTDEVEYWSITEYSGNLVFVNGLDIDGGSSGINGIMKYDGSSITQIDTTYSGTSKIRSAKFCWTFNNYLFLGNVSYDGQSSDYAARSSIFNSSLGEGLNSGGFEQSDTVDAGMYIVEGRGNITGAGITGSNFVVFKTDSCRRYWFAGGSIPFNSESLHDTLGTRAPGSIINGRAVNSLYFYGTDNNFHEISRGNIGRPIVVSENNINPEGLNKIRAKFIREHKQIWWSVPIGDEQETNNKCLIYGEDGRWAESSINVSAFGEYSQTESLTWETSGNLWPTWADIPANITWSSFSHSSGAIIDICGDSNGYIYRTSSSYLDNGSSYDSYFVLSTDVADKSALPYKKRISQIYIYLDNLNTDGDVFVDAKRQFEGTYQRIAKFTTTGSESNSILRLRQPVSFIADEFLIKISSTSRFSFIGIEFDYEVIGDR